MIHPFDVDVLSRSQWATGDFVVGAYVERDEKDEVETTSGSLQQLKKGDLVVGSLGCRASTQENVGDWHLIKDDNIMHDICGSGMFGLETSFSCHYHSSPPFVYQGHVLRDGCKVRMEHFVPVGVVPTGPLDCPTVVLVGTSMSSGKTVSAKVVVQVLKELGFARVVYGKFTGGGYYHDILALAKHADSVTDFVEAGLPSTNMPSDECRKVLPTIFGLLASKKPDCVVLELGASPCEPYNGDVVLQEILSSDKRNQNFVILCASDAYSVVGFHNILATITDVQADVVSGIAANTSTAREFVKELSGIPALSLETDASVHKLRSMLYERFVK